MEMSPWRQTDKQPESKNTVSQQIDKRLLTFATIFFFLANFHPSPRPALSSPFVIKRTQDHSELRIKTDWMNSLPECNSNLSPVARSTDCLLILPIVWLNQSIAINHHLHWLQCHLQSPHNCSPRTEAIISKVARCSRPRSKIVIIVIDIDVLAGKQRITNDAACHQRSEHSKSWTTEKSPPASSSSLGKHPP